MVLDIKEMLKKELDKSTVFKNKEYISSHYIPDVLPFREEEIQEIITILAPALKQKKTNNLFVYGKTGTGKTSSVKKVLQKIDEICNECNSMEGTIQNFYINCRNHGSKYKILLKTINALNQSQFFGYSSSFIYDKFVDFLNNNKVNIILVLDEVDLIKDIDETLYALTRINDEIKQSSVSIIGISNNVMFKEKLDPRNKSSLCEKELIFPPYNAKELREILKQRVKISFYPDTVAESALALAAAYSAQESGDARTALMLMENAGEVADKKQKRLVTDLEVQDAKKRVEEEIIISMISTLPEQVQLVLYSSAKLTKERKFSATLTDSGEVIYSGDLYNEYFKMAKQLGKTPVSTKWFKQYLDELNTYGLVVTIVSGKGVRGNTTLVKLGFDVTCTLNVLKKQLGL
jgi:archaeal cell division control protein 6